MPADEPSTTPVPERRRSKWIRAWRAYIQDLKDSVDEARRRHKWVDVAVRVIDRDAEVGGGIMAGALAYRLFIWLLPFALVLIGVLGVVSDATSDTPRETAGSVGVAGLVSRSVAEAAGSTGHWYALVIGLPVLLWTTRSLLRALIGVHRLVWSDLRERTPKPTVLATLRCLLWLVTVVSLLPLAKQALGGGVIAVLLVGCLYGGMWFVLSTYLPHRVTPWTALVPGAVLFAVGAELIAVLTNYVLGPYAASREDTYGALGVAAALLLGLFFIARLIVLSAVVNRTLSERPA